MIRKTSRLDKAELQGIERAVAHFEANRKSFELVATSLVEAFQASARLEGLLHFVRYRVKDPNHLREKLERKMLEARQVGERLEINETNLFERVTDLAGVRLIHLHTDQLREIHPGIIETLDQWKYRLIEGPVANCWDVEYEKFFSELGIEPRSRESMYSTIHYVVEANSRDKITCELQVRTLMDEVWGEVSHRVNYPAPTKSRVCEDQLRVLARLTTGCTRLVDSIFKSNAESNETNLASD